LPLDRFEQFAARLSRACMPLEAVGAR